MHANLHRSLPVAPLLLFLALLPMGTTGAAPIGAVQSFVEIDGQGPSALVDARGGLPRLGRDSLVVPMPLELRIAPGVSKPVSLGLVRAVAGESPPSIAVVRASGGGVVERIKLSAPILTRLELTGFGSDPAPVELIAQFLGNTYKVEGPGPMTAPTTPRPVSAGRLVLGSLALEPIGVDGVGMTFNPAESLARGARRCNDFSIVAPYADASGLFDWYVQSVPSGGVRGTPMPRTAELLLPDRAGNLAPLASMTGVVITGFGTYVESDGSLRVEATFSCTAFTLAPDAFR